MNFNDGLLLNPTQIDSSVRKARVVILNLNTVGYLTKLARYRHRCPLLRRIDIVHHVAPRYGDHEPIDPFRFPRLTFVAFAKMNIIDSDGIPQLGFLQNWAQVVECNRQKYASVVTLYRCLYPLIGRDVARMIGNMVIDHCPWPLRGAIVSAANFR